MTVRRVLIGLYAIVQLVVAILLIPQMYLGWERVPTVEGWPSRTRTVVNVLPKPTTLLPTMTVVSERLARASRLRWAALVGSFGVLVISGLGSYGKRARVLCGVVYDVGVGMILVGSLVVTTLGVVGVLVILV